MSGIPTSFRYPAAWESAVQAPVRVRRFIDALTQLADEGLAEDRLHDAARAPLAELVAHDAWLPARWAQPDPERYQQFLLYRDPAARFSVVSFVWAPGQATPVHDFMHRAPRRRGLPSFATMVSISVCWTVR